MIVTLPGLPRRLAILAVLTGLLLALVASPSAQAAGGSTALLRDCQDGTISGRYSQADYAEALRDIPTDVDEYTDCRSVIRRAQLGAAGGGGTGSGGAGGGTGAAGGLGLGSGGGTGGAATGGGDATASGAQSADTVLRSASPAERAGVAAARAGAATAPAQVAGRTIRPQQLVSGAGISHASLPTPVLLSLIALGLAALGALALWTKGRVDARRTAGA